MRKLIFAIIILLISTICYSQKMYFDIGNTRIKDSTGYTTFNKSLLIYNNAFVKGYISLDTLASGKIYYDGVNVAFQNTKQYGGYNFSLGEKYSSIFVSKSSGGTGLPILTIDSTGLNISTGMTYKINGSPITGGTTNLYGYAYKDSNDTFTKHVKLKQFTIWETGADSIQFLLDNTLSSGDLVITPTGSSVTLGTTKSSGTKDLYAGEYYRGSTLLTTYYNTNTTLSNVAYLNKANTFSTGTQTVQTLNAISGYELNSNSISWGVSTISRTALTVSSSGSYAKIDSLTLAKGTYMLSYSMQVNFLAGSGSTLTDYSYTDIYDGSSTITNSEIYTGCSYTTAGINGEFRIYTWNVKV